MAKMLSLKEMSALSGRDAVVKKVAPRFSVEDFTKASVEKILRSMDDARSEVDLPLNFHPAAT